MLAHYRKVSRAKTREEKFVSRVELLLLILKVRRFYDVDFLVPGFCTSWHLRLRRSLVRSELHEAGNDFIFSISSIKDTTHPAFVFDKIYLSRRCLRAFAESVLNEQATKFTKYHEVHDVVHVVLLGVLRVHFLRDH